MPDRTPAAAASMLSEGRGWRRGEKESPAGRFAARRFRRLLPDLKTTPLKVKQVNTLHPLRRRCARWLLQTQDRIHSHEFGLSHEILAIMLGAQRPTVTLVAGSLQKAGLIRYRHGQVIVLDRKGLERESCEC